MFFKVNSEIHYKCISSTNDTKQPLTQGKTVEQGTLSETDRTTAKLGE